MRFPVLLLAAAQWEVEAQMDPFMLSLMSKNKKGGAGFDPFLLSLVSDSPKQNSNPMLMNMLMSGKTNDIGPLMPLFMTGKTKEDPLLMMMLLVTDHRVNILF